MPVLRIKYVPIAGTVSPNGADRSSGHDSGDWNGPASPSAGPARTRRRARPGHGFPPVRECETAPRGRGKNGSGGSQVVKEPGDVGEVDPTVAVAVERCHRLVRCDPGHLVEVQVPRPRSPSSRSRSHRRTARRRSCRPAAPPRAGRQRHAGSPPG